MESPTFRDLMAYAPEHVYKDKNGKVRIYDEMWTADWWWNTQVRTCTEVLFGLLISATAETPRGCNNCPIDRVFR